MLSVGVFSIRSHAERGNEIKKSGAFLSFEESNLDSLIVISLAHNARITCFPYMAEILPAKQKSRICDIGKSGSCDCYVSVFTVKLAS